MNNGTFKYIEQMLIDFNKIDDHIEDRIKALKYPVVHADENIGGGKSNLISNPTERLAITLADDLMLSNLRKTKQILESVLEALEEKPREVIELYYIDEPRKLTWAGVALETNYSERQCHNIRDAVFKEVAQKLGMPT